MTASKVYNSVDEYPKEFLRCRGTRQHFWAFKTDIDLVAGPGGRLIEFTRTRNCMSCKSQVHTTYSVEENGHFVFTGRKYNYADGYVIRKGSSIERDRMRDELFMMELREAVGMDSRVLNLMIGEGS